MPNSKILAIETSCDDTAVALIDQGKVVAMKVGLQPEHAALGGVVPELASRLHDELLLQNVIATLQEAKSKLHEIGAIAYTKGPGLMGALLVGANFAKGLATGLNIPTIGVHHMYAHLMAVFIEHPMEFPFLGCTVSGGHTQLVWFNSPTDFYILGETLDDAAGEAFDKVAKMLGLPYPGGPSLSKAALLGNPNAFQFPKTKLKGYDFSFSGFKSAMLYFLRDQTAINPQFISQRLPDIAASAEKYIVEAIMAKIADAATTLKPKAIVIAGGVSANNHLRATAKEWCNLNGVSFLVPDPAYCTDNAAMIGFAAWFKWKANLFDPLNLVPQAKLPLKPEFI